MGLKDSFKLLMQAGANARIDALEKSFTEATKSVSKDIADLKKAGGYIDKNGKIAFKLNENWIMTEDRGQLVLRHDGVEYYAFTFHSGINYEYPERSLGISPEEQRQNNL